MTPRNWEDLAAKANYVKGTAAKRAAVALDSAVEDAHVLISVVKTHVPSHMKISDHCLVELLFTIIARMGKQLQQFKLQWQVQKKLFELHSEL